MKVKLQRGGVKDGEFFVTNEEIEVDDGWFAHNVQAFVPPNSTIYVGQHVYDAFKAELAKLSKSGGGPLVEPMLRKLRGDNTQPPTEDA